MKHSLVLIGMPSCGKTTVGALAAQRLNCPFADMDEAIVARIGMPIAAFFTKFGENAFRDTEAAVARELSMRASCVIATGGGVVLRQENMEVLKSHGLVCYLQRDIDKLLCSDPTRPLSKSRDALTQMAAFRLPLYEAYADFSVKNQGSVTDTADRLVTAFLKREEEPCK